MRFTFGPWVYRLRVCPGPLFHEGSKADALTHERSILLAGTLSPRDRLEPLLDQLRRLQEKHFGEMTPQAIGTFTASVMRQLLAQGGEPALMRLAPDGTNDHGGVEDLGAEPVGCECGTCGTKYGSHQIVTGAAELDPRLGLMVVGRSVYCDFCGHVQSWTEGATSAGTPNGRVVAGPVYSRSHVSPS